MAREKQLVMYKGILIRLSAKFSAATRVELETLIPSEISQKEKNKYHISLISGI